VSTRHAEHHGESYLRAEGQGMTSRGEQHALLLEKQRALEDLPSTLPRYYAAPPPSPYPGSDAEPGLRWPAGYEILGLIGAGAFGSVYKTRQTSFNRLVALNGRWGP